MDSCSVTTVMPTTEARSGLWDKAIGCFLSQTFKDSRLLILDETNDPDRRAWPDRVDYVHMRPQGLTTGAKRNTINGLVDSELIIHWDDDDWSEPDRLRRQVELLRSSGRQVVGFHDLLYFREDDRSFWQYRFSGQKPYATGTSMLYRREWWDAHRFPDKKVAEDTEFWLTAQGAGQLASESGLGLIVARAHGGNTFKPQFGREPFTSADRGMFPEEFLRLEGL